MTEALKLPIIDLISPDRISTANSIRQACIDYGFFYLVNHGMEEELLGKVFEESKKFFLLPLEEKMKMPRKEHRGYTPLYAENLDPTSSSKGDSKESFYIGPLEDITTPVNLNQWPSEEILPSWRHMMESFYRKLLSAGKRLLSLIALALNVEEDFFEKVGALDKPNAFLRLLHYPGELGSSDDEIYGSSAHSDYGMVTLLATDGVQGLQVCREKFKQPRVWEDVLHVDGALIVNIGDIMERWTNCLFRSTMHRVMLSGKERYSVLSTIYKHLGV
ncbi:2-oxoglutarate-Fe(II) type oxidoreductase hxnY isoform X2 [Quercus lobata]|uniref:2-oxoglutarate-Fe(II) type oxidoreductase hxnY isoform X2 n=1 Tax=Quercus lobata TaxID=97700 RepID=UPI0012464F10|nr:2-oxoglutarate-Fe(II) type oxidoreductase hxnY isoform X2 [Quercus lobata]